MGENVIYLSKKYIQKTSRTFFLNMLAQGFERLSNQEKETLMVLLKAFLHDHLGNLGKG